MVKNILWDFDGVILDSMPIRDKGFIEIFKDFDNEKVDLLLQYHKKNGGLSRYVKIRYFFENILNKSISDDEILNYAGNFSNIMKTELINPDNLINDSITFIRKNYKNYNFHIVSGSDQNELRFLCQELGIFNLFISIQGSPTHKNELVKNILIDNDYIKEETILIGDSINDYYASIENNIDFFAYNCDKELEKINEIRTISTFEKVLNFKYSYNKK